MLASPYSAQNSSLFMGIPDNIDRTLCVTVVVSFGWRH
jgi:hypothetical protein